jgi:5'-3' exonuclease
LCGCDYTPKISQIGPVKAYKFIKEEKSIEKVLEKIINDDKLKKKH